MNAFFYGVALQLKLDIRSRSLFVTCYAVPLLFFLLMGSIFTSVMPEMKETLIPAMIILGVSMGAFIGLPPSLLETYGSDIKKVYKANGVSLYSGLATMLLSTFIHLMILCVVILLLAPVLFQADFPVHIPRFFLALALYLAASLGLGAILGLAVKSQAKLTTVSQIIFLPSIMLSGTMFPTELLPEFLKTIGKFFPATWGYRLMLEPNFPFGRVWYLLLVLLGAAIICILLLKKQNS